MRLPRLKRLQPLVRPLLWFTAVSGLIYPVWKDMSTNLLADSAALWFGLFVIDRILERERERDRAPALRACHAEAHDIFSRTVSIVRNAVELGAQAEHIEVLKEVMESREFRKLAPLAAGIDIDAKAPYGWKIGDLNALMTWREYITYWGGDILKRIDRFIQRYASVAEPELLEAMQRLEGARILDYFKFEDRLPEPLKGNIPPETWIVALEMIGRLCDLLRPPLMSNPGWPLVSDTTITHVYNTRVRDRGLA